MILGNTLHEKRRDKEGEMEKYLWHLAVNSVTCMQKRLHWKDCVR